MTINFSFFFFISSACPEKIAEFEERRALTKKQNHHKPRLKKSENRSALAEIDLKLQTLLLEIEAGSNAAFNTSFPSQIVMSEDRTTANATYITNQKPLNAESESNANCSAAAPCFHADPSCGKHEVIDLLSPSPLTRPHTVSKFQQVNDQHIDVIDLSDSENEMSPEHARKARELRLFLASIRDDIS